jgi:hypothetical protein
MSVRRLMCLVVLATSLPVATVSAQELEPRFYTNLPVGLNFLAVGYARSEGGVLVDPSISLENADIAIDGPFAGYARSLRFGNRSGKFDAGIGNVCIDGSADSGGERVERYTCGWTDARVRLGVNLAGAPPLTMQDFANYRQDLVVGASLALSAPVGDYDPGKLVNIGTNRWAAKVELGASKAWQRWLFELSVSTTLFQDNDDFFGGRVRKQEPLSALQAHVVRGFASGVWLSLDATWYRGGETETDGVDNANRQSNARFGVTLSMPVNRRHSLKFNASTGVQTRTGSDFDTAGVAWQYLWGSPQ